MKAVNNGQEISNRLSIMIFKKKKCSITKLSFKHPPCHVTIKTIHYPRCIENQPMSALADCEGTSRLVVIGHGVDYRCYCRNDGRFHFVFTLSALVEPF